MLLPETIHPKDCIYYTGALVLHILHNLGPMSIEQLYVEVKKKEPMSFPVLLLSLDWLYLVDVAIINEKGNVKLCISNH